MSGYGSRLEAFRSSSASLQLDLGEVASPTGYVPALAGGTWHFQAAYRDAVMGQPASNPTDELTG